MKQIFLLRIFKFIIFLNNFDFDIVSFFFICESIKIGFGTLSNILLKTYHVLIIIHMKINTCGKWENEENSLVFPDSVCGDFNKAISLDLMLKLEY